jgi:hypothetical protein
MQEISLLIRLCELFFRIWKQFHPPDPLAIRGRQNPVTAMMISNGPEKREKLKMTNTQSKEKQLKEKEDEDSFD